MTYAHLDGGAREALEAALAGRSAGISVRTSGTTGTPRAVHLSAAAVRWSASASVERLGGPGAWLLALPPERIGGAMVIARALLTDTALVTHPNGPFTVESFVRATRGLPSSGRRYTSLVPTQ